MLVCALKCRCEMAIRQAGTSSKQYTITLSHRRISTKPSSSEKNPASLLGQSRITRSRNHQNDGYLTILRPNQFLIVCNGTAVEAALDNLSSKRT
jgi:hypothetical protein